MDRSPLPSFSIRRSRSSSKLLNGHEEALVGTSPQRVSERVHTDG
jgi:hypothetical protein